MKSVIKKYMILAPVLILSICLFIGCLEEINLETEMLEGNLVVYGELSNNPGPYAVTIGRLNGNSMQITEDLHGASVSVYDSRQSRHQYTELLPGRFMLLEDDFQFYAGEEYRLSIELLDGTRYQSISEKVPDVPLSINPDFEISNISEISSSGQVRERPSVNVFVNAIVPERDEPMYLKWEIEQVYRFQRDQDDTTCYVYENKTRNNQVLSSVLSTGEVHIQNENLMNVRTDGHKHFYKNVFNVINKKITENRHDYLRKVNSLVGESATIYDTPPALIKGNMYNPDDPYEDVFGYFKAFHVDTTRFLVWSDDFDFYIPHPCLEAPVHRYCSEPCKSNRGRPWYY